MLKKKKHIEMALFYRVALIMLGIIFARGEVCSQESVSPFEVNRVLQSSGFRSSASEISAFEQNNSIIKNAVAPDAKAPLMTTIGNTWKIQEKYTTTIFDNGVPRKELCAWYIKTCGMAEQKQVGDKIYSCFRPIKSNWKADRGRFPEFCAPYSGYNEILMREENDKIYVLFRAYDFEGDPQELVVFDYNLQVGDTIPCNTVYTLRKGNDEGDHFDYHKSRYVFVTKKVDTLFYAGANRRIYYFEPGEFSRSGEYRSLKNHHKSEGWLGGTTLFVEGIGFINQYGAGLCFNYPYGIMGPAYGGIDCMAMPRCFIDADGVSHFITPIIDEASLLNDPENPDCDFYFSNLENEQIDEALKPYVYVDGETMVVKMSDLKEHHLNVYDSSGQNIASCPGFTGEYRMSLSGVGDACLFIAIDYKYTLKVIL